MLKHRLLFGILMTIFFIAIVLFDGYLDGSLNSSPKDDKPIQATLLCLLVALVIGPAMLELARLAVQKQIKLLLPVSLPASVVLATAHYWLQFTKTTATTLLFILAAALLAGFGFQYLRYGLSNVLTNCGASAFSVLYLGILPYFLPAIRIDFGPWHVLMFVFVVKSADIGAYTAGRLFGRHKFSPNISPGKTWEGMAGAVIAAIIVAVLFAAFFDIMSPALAAAFGLLFAFIGQLGDLSESMIKRDVQQKDSANTVPGFGGILDIIDSLLLAAPCAYLFFLLLN